MQIRAIKKKDYSLILKLDKAVYPTNTPVTKLIIKEWYKNNPEFGLVFEENNKIVGVCIIIPLNKKGWDEFTNGKLNESQLKEEKIFSNKTHTKIGLHIYHIEKINKKVKSISIQSLKKIKKIIKNLRKKNAELKIIGFSGLCVTQSGINLFKEKYGCKENRMKSKEYILRKKGKKIVAILKNAKEVKKKMKNGFIFENRCELLLTQPKDNNLVWNYLN